MFSFGKTSEANLAGVHPDLVRVARRAISITAQDFGITQGVRTDTEQLRDWLRHTSKLNGIPVGATVDGVQGTGRGNHQINRGDGMGHAIDATPFINGVILWSAVPESQQWNYIYEVAEAMRAAATAEGVLIRWGGVWDRTLNLLPPGAAAMKLSVLSYEARHAGPDFIDGPHYEML